MARFQTLFLNKDYAVLFLLEYCKRIAAVSRSDDDFEKYLVDFFGRFGVNFAVCNDYTSECRYRVAGKGVVPCVEQCVARCETAGVVMLEDGDCRVVEFFD